MNKYSVGETVKVAQDPMNKGLGPGFGGSMEGYRGRIVTIDEIYHDANWYRIKEDSHSFWWNEQWLEPVTQESKSQKPKKETAPREYIEVAAETATLYYNPGGKQAKVKQHQVATEDLLGTVVKETLNQQQIIRTPLLPSNSRFYEQRGTQEVLVVEDVPRMRTILIESGKTYNLAFPYLVYVFYFHKGDMTEYRSRLFFRTKPLADLKDKLQTPSLTHTMVKSTDDYKVGAMCMKAHPDPGLTLQDKIKSNLDYYWNSTFSYMEGGDGYNDFFKAFAETRKQDARLGTLELWQIASAENPLFVLEVPWLDPNMTLAEVIEEDFKLVRSAGRQPKLVQTFQDLVDRLYKIPAKEEKRV